MSFEQNPLLMVPFILSVVAGYDIAKAAIRHLMSTRARQHDR